YLPTFSASSSLSSRRASSMDFYAVLDQVLDLLRQRGRVTYNALKRQFDLDDACLQDLKDEIIHMDYSAVGETTHLAARMEQLAMPGSSRLTAATDLYRAMDMTFWLPQAEAALVHLEG